MKVNFDYKVPNGKLLRLNINFSDNKIKEIKLCGDFFMHPEEAVSDIENSLIGSAIEKDSIIKKVSEVVKEKNAALFGINAEAIADAIIAAHGRCEDGK